MVTIEAKFFNRIAVAGKWRSIVIHCTESSEREGGARGVARWFSNPWNPRRRRWVKGSAHFVCDSKEVICCVPEHRYAYHCRGYNYSSLGIEIVGRAAQTREEWLDEYSRPALFLAAQEAGRLGHLYGVPVHRFLTDVEIRGKVAGLTTHRDVSRALKIPGGHTDPGPNFPRDEFLEMLEFV